jgi:FkbM family methyltransferase
MLARIMSLFGILRHPRYCTSLAAENASLKAQLAAAGAELAYVRRREGTSSDAREIEYTERRTLILVPRLLDLLPENDRLLIVDAGARDVDQDPRWRPFPTERMTFIGFEPDKEEATRLNAMSVASAKRHFVAAALGEQSGTREFEHNNIGGGSSFLRQNRGVTDRWKFENPGDARNARDIFFPLKNEEVVVVSLADWAANAQIGKIDFLKLNVQGAETDILIGAGALLDDILGILVEVSFVESYCDRPMFVDIDVMLRKRGFSFFDLLAHHYVGRAESPIAAQHLTVSEGKLGQLVSSWGQLIEGHALYLRDPIAEGTPREFERTIKLAALAEAFGQVEFAFELLGWLGKRPDIAAGPKAEKLGDLVASATSEYARLQRPGTPRPFHTESSTSDREI